MNTSSHYLPFLMPFVYWAVISILYNISKIIVMKHRLKEDASGQWLFYAGGTALAIAAGAVAAHVKELDGQVIDPGTFILVWLPTLLGLRKGFRMGMYEIEQWEKGVRRI